jgi:N-methylhydantoinase A
MFPSIEVLTIGAGGGSLAWIDEAGSLRNGPQSAGADPGPACYGRGGTQPTNSDANLVLGRLGEALAGGVVTLDGAVAAQAVWNGVAQPLGLDLHEAALAIIRVANANMADAVRLISIRRGYDPRDFALVVFGGAGPLHGAALAKELSIPSVIVPPNPGVTSAFGCLLVDIRHDIQTMFLGRVNDVDPTLIEERFQELEAEGRERLANESVPPERMHLQRLIDMRYLGQWRSLSIPVDSPLTSLREGVQRFHEEHGREHNYRRDDAPVEIYRLHVVATGITPKAELARHQANGTGRPEPIAVRETYFDEHENALRAPVYNRAHLEPGIHLEGPAIIEQVDSTTLIPPAVMAEIDEYLNIRMTIPEDAP